MPLSKKEASVCEVILARRSVRKYTKQALDQSKINTLIEAAVHAPTAMHREPWAFVVVENQQLLLDISDKAKSLIIKESSHSINKRYDLDHLDREANIFHDAGTLITICGNIATPFVMADCWLAAENLMLTACAMGLGSCVIGYALPALNDPEIKRILKIPDNFTAISPIVVGYPAEFPTPSYRKAPVVFSRISDTPMSIP